MSRPPLPRRRCQQPSGHAPRAAWANGAAAPGLLAGDVTAGENPPWPRERRWRRRRRRRGPAARRGPARSMAKHHRTPLRSAEPVIEVKSKVSAHRHRRGHRHRRVTAAPPPRRAAHVERHHAAGSGAGARPGGRSPPLRRRCPGPPRAGAAASRHPGIHRARSVRPAASPGSARQMRARAGARCRRPRCARARGAHLAQMCSRPDVRAGASPAVLSPRCAPPARDEAPAARPDVRTRTAVPSPRCGLPPRAMCLLIQMCAHLAHSHPNGYPHPDVCPHPDVPTHPALRSPRCVPSLSALSSSCALAQLCPCLPGTPSGVRSALLPGTHRPPPAPGSVLSPSGSAILAAFLSLFLIGFPFVMTEGGNN